MSPRVSRPHMPDYGIFGPDEGEGLLAFEWAEERLVASRRYWLSTVRPDGRPHAMPVWGVWVDDLLYFDTAATSRKSRNLEQNAACVVTTESAREAVIVEGVARRVGDAAARAHVHDLYQAKYAQEAPPPGALYAVVPYRVFAFIEDADRFQSTATRWTFR